MTDYKVLLKSLNLLRERFPQSPGLHPERKSGPAQHLTDAEVVAEALCLTITVLKKHILSG